MTTDNPNEWLQIHIHTNSQYVEELDSLLMSLGALAITLQDEGNQPILEPDVGSMPLWLEIKLTALFDANTPTDMLIECLHQQAPNQSIKAIAHEKFADRIWERQWLVDFQPININNRLLVAPTDWPSNHLPITRLTLDPGLAFGTGSHPTTHMCLEWLTLQNIQDQVVIDYGCGSGILAIAAALLGARHVYAIDVDPQAITATLENAAKNNVSHAISAHLADGNYLGFQPQPVSILVANILAGPLVELKNNFLQYTLNHGAIALAGLLDTQAEAIINAYRPEFELSVRLNKQEWSLLAGFRLS